MTALAWTLLVGSLLSFPTSDLAQNAEGSVDQAAHFHAVMDGAFGAGNWRETSGYRSPEREDELRREGAGTVPAGAISHHSMGTRGAPGAYDVVVSGMSSAQAAEKLKGSPAVARVVAERAHGEQGPHLHIEPAAYGNGRAVSPAPDSGDGIYLRVVNGRRNPLLSRSVHHVIVVD